MEDKHKEHLLAKFPGDMKYKHIQVVDIPDEYQYMDPQLIEELRTAVDPLLFCKNST